MFVLWIPLYFRSNNRSPWSGFAILFVNLLRRKFSKFCHNFTQKRCFRRTETETSNEFSNRSRVAQQGKMKMSKCNKDIISRRLDNQQIEATGFGDNKILFDSSSWRYVMRVFLYFLTTTTTTRRKKCFLPVNVAAL